MTTNETPRPDDARDCLCHYCKALFTETGMLNHACANRPFAEPERRRCIRDWLIYDRAGFLRHGEWPERTKADINRCIDLLNARVQQSNKEILERIESAKRDHDSLPHIKLKPEQSDEEAADKYVYEEWNTSERKVLLKVHAKFDFLAGCAHIKKQLAWEPAFPENIAARLQELEKELGREKTAHEETKHRMCYESETAILKLINERTTLESRLRHEERQVTAKTELLNLAEVQLAAYKDALEKIREIGTKPSKIHGSLINPQAMIAGEALNAGGV